MQVTLTVQFTVGARDTSAHLFCFAPPPGDPTQLFQHVLLPGATLTTSLVVTTYAGHVWILIGLPSKSILARFAVPCAAPTLLIQAHGDDAPTSEQQLQSPPQRLRSPPQQGSQLQQPQLSVSAPASLQSRRALVHDLVSRAIANVLSCLPRRDQPKGARSQAAKRRRWAKRRAKLAATANRAATDIHSTSTAPCSSSTTHDPAAALREAALREHLLQRQLKSAQLRVKAERQRSRRELKLAVARGQQAARRATKAAARKRKAARAAAARAMANRAVKRPPATGELHHSGAKKRRATLANMA
ncbi:hypothetical protein AB1Y20_006432 [Prymnesium parvum]|uniref:Uncharacterized protein n=1 Tax=Prymnesium parvum TaxID=97485 RepID=A0AB34J0K5_PRYPA|mmetsp:Transcript_20513/g.51203  ORF Transcript_20513/g.51203 Transcript_20513/m.51203 type:complete len:302 (-) Transcript_20513:651-1556(-)